ncbi:hypothetical protein [Saccharopolyspora thermophila]|uniref:hypothetical protein n=1 Tax=Saccharopolyspora thermophila TaxID=89367 RepID=UPI00166A09C4|nr:hypothetical protein [Saccharopolyspora subtropica]
MAADSFAFLTFCFNLRDQLPDGQRSLTASGVLRAVGSPARRDQVEGGYTGDRGQLRQGD